MLPGRTRTDARGESSDGGSGGSRLRRLLVVAGTTAVVAYLVRRLRASGTRSPGRPEAHTIDVDGTAPGDAAGADATEGGESGADAGAGDVNGVDASEADADDLDRDAAAERAVEDADDSPAPPGEMEVAEELAEDALDEDVDAAESDETPGPDAEDAETGE